MAETNRNAIVGILPKMKSALLYNNVRRRPYFSLGFGASMQPIHAPAMVIVVAGCCDPVDFHNDSHQDPNQRDQP